MSQKKENKNRSRKTPAIQIQEKKSPLALMYILIFAIACIPYLNAINNEYTLDDSIVFTSNQFVLEGISGIKDIMTHDTFSGFFGRESTALAGGRYRPLSLVTFAIEYSLFGRAPHLSHFINILLYAFAGFLLFQLLRKMFSSSNLIIPFAITILYIAHPIHTEAVTNIKGRDEILSFLFLVYSINILYRFLINNKIYLYLISLTLFFISLLSKENAITFIVIIPMILFFFSDYKMKRILAVSSGYLCIAGVFLLMRNHFAAGTGSDVTEILNNSFAGASWDQKYASIADIMNRYFLILILPYPLSFDYSYNQIPLIHFTHWRAIAGVLVNISLLTYAILNFRKKDVLAFCILFYYISISIVSNVFFPVGTSMSERFLFTPSLAFSIAVVFLMVKFFKMDALKKFSGFFVDRNFSILLITLLIIYSSIVYARNPDWKNNFTLFTHDVENSPESVKALIGAGGEYIARANKQKDSQLKTADLKAAISYLNKAVEIYPKYSNAWMLLGNAHFGLYSSADTAIYYYRKAIAETPSYGDAYYNIGYLLTGKKNEEAIDAFRQVLRANPKHLEALYHMAICYKNLHQPDSALFVLGKLKSIKNNMVKAYQLSGLIYGESGRLEEAALNLRKAVELDPDNVENYLNLGIAYGKMGNTAKAVEILSSAHQQDPSNANVLMAIGVSYQNAGDMQKAREYFEKAFVLNPSLRRQ
jgi:tetratricopeptide (TPR) repeat protein